MERFAIELESVQCVVTSPPYFGLRDYGTARWEGGDPNCDHRTSAKGTKEFGNPEFNLNRPSRQATKTVDFQFRGVCGKCGSLRLDQQIGIESSLDEYVQNLVEVFRLIRPVLKKDGVCFLNLGDSFAGGFRGSGAITASSKQKSNRGTLDFMGRGPLSIPNGLKPKDLCLMPHRVALALQADGWWIRGDYCWQKNNPMPSSTKDRCTLAHEYVFHLVKSKKYFWDADAIKEPCSNAGKVVSLGEKSFSRGLAAGAGRTPSGNALKDTYEVKEFRNRRSVWTTSLQPYKGAHFATMALSLVEIMIKAGSRPGDLVLDPFSGAASTGLVACQLGRDYIGIDLNGAYNQLAKERLERAGIEVKVD